MKLRFATFGIVLAIGGSIGASDNLSTNQSSLDEEKAAVAIALENLRATGELEDMQKLGLLTHRVENITSGDLFLATLQFKAEYFPLGVKPADWESIPAPDLRGTNDPGAVQAFIQTNGWNMNTGMVSLAWGFGKTKPIKGLPWNAIKHRQFEAITANGILYVVLGGFAHNAHGVAYNPQTNRFSSAITGFSPIGGHWYAWREPEDPMTLKKQYEGGAEPAIQTENSVNGNWPIRSETNSTSPTPAANATGRP